MPPYDKLLHFSAGYIGADWTVALTHKVWTGPIASAVLGVAKETFDSMQRGNHFDMMDLGATILGGGVHFAIHF